MHPYSFANRQTQYRVASAKCSLNALMLFTKAIAALIYLHVSRRRFNPFSWQRPGTSPCSDLNRMSDERLRACVGHHRRDLRSCVLQLHTQVRYSSYFITVVQYSSCILYCTVSYCTVLNLCSPGAGAARSAGSGRFRRQVCSLHKMQRKPPLRPPSAPRSRQCNVSFA